MKTSFLLLLTFLGLALEAASQAPGDHSLFCRTGPDFVDAHKLPPEWEILVDTFDYLNLVVGPIGTWRASSEDSDTSTFRQNGGACERTTSVCTQQPDQNNWLFSQFIRYEDAKEVYFNLTYSLSKCTKCSTDYLTLHRFDTNDRVSTALRTNPGNYKPMFGTEESSRLSLAREETLGLVRPSDTEGFYLGVHDAGTCGTFGRVIVYYTVCRARSVGLVEYPQFSTPPKNGPNVVFQAKCVPNAHNVTSLDVIAVSATSTCMDSAPEGAKCECDAGYELSLDGTACERCPAGEYRALGSAPVCQPCPANTVTDVSGAAQCHCLPGMYRSKEEGPDAACSVPPSGVRDLDIEESGSTELVITWKRPEVTGNDLYYEIFISDSIDVSATSGEAVEPSLRDRSEVVDYILTGLKPFTSYFITVVTHNAVSDQDIQNQVLRTARVVGKTTEGVPGAPSLNRLCTVVIWKAPSETAGILTGYEVRLGGPSSNIIISFGPNENFYITTGEQRTKNALVEIRAKNSYAASQWTDPQPLDCSSMSGCSTPAPTTPPTEATTPPTVVPVFPGSSIIGGGSIAACQLLLAPSNGEVFVDNREAVYNCDEGFALSGGSQTRQCLDDGSWTGEAPTCQPTCTSQPLYFTLRGLRYENNSQIPLALLGENGDALHAVTGHPTCCRTLRVGEFFYPDNTMVGINNDGEALYRNRDNQLIRLHRRLTSDISSIPRGKYHCELPDDCGKMVTLYVNLV